MELEPLGMVLEAIGVSHEAAANTAVLLDAAAEHRHRRGPSTELGGADDRRATTSTVSRRRREVVEEVAALCGPDGVDLAAAGDLLAAATSDDDGEWERPTPALLVRVLGPPRLEPEPRRVDATAADGGRVRGVVGWGGDRRRGP